MNCDLRCLRATVDLATMRRLLRLRAGGHSVFVLVNIGPGWILRLDDPA